MFKVRASVDPQGLCRESRPFDHLTRLLTSLETRRGAVSALVQLAWGNALGPVARCPLLRQRPCVDHERERVRGLISSDRPDPDQGKSRASVDTTCAPEPIPNGTNPGCASDCAAPQGGTASCDNGGCIRDCTVSRHRICGSGAGVCQECCDDTHCLYLGEGSSCWDGTCQCPAGLTFCEGEGECVDTSIEPFHCGGCDQGARAAAAWTGGVEPRSHAALTVTPNWTLSADWAIVPATRSASDNLDVLVPTRQSGLRRSRLLRLCGRCGVASCGCCPDGRCRCGGSCCQPHEECLVFEPGPVTSDQECLVLEIETFQPDGTARICSPCDRCGREVLLQLPKRAVRLLR